MRSCFPFYPTAIKDPPHGGIRGIRVNHTESSEFLNKGGAGPGVGGQKKKQKKKKKKTQFAFFKTKK